MTRMYVNKEKKAALLALPEDERQEAVAKMLEEHRHKRKLYAREYTLKYPERIKKANEKHKVKKRKRSKAMTKAGVVRKQYPRCMAAHMEYKKGWEARNKDKVKETSRRSYQRTKAVKMARENPKELRALLAKQVPGYLDLQARNDVVNEAMSAILNRQVYYDDLGDCVKPFVTAHNKMFDYWKTVSLDAPVAGTDDLRMIDLLPAAENYDEGEQGRD